MYAVMFGEWGECWGEYETLAQAQRVCDRLNEDGTDAWICSDEDASSDYDLESGFDCYEGCYTFDC